MRWCEVSKRGMAAAEGARENALRPFDSHNNIRLH